MLIPIDKVGKITQGDQCGRQVKILDDSDSTGGFLICTSQDFNDPNAEGFDDWVQDLETLRAYFDESNWIIQWID